MSKPTWDSAPTWANYLAQDENGAWWWYGEEPELNGYLGQWDTTGPNHEQADRPPALSWQETLETRPE